MLQSPSSFKEDIINSFTATSTGTQSSIVTRPVASQPQVLCSPALLIFSLAVSYLFPFLITVCRNNYDQIFYFYIAYFYRHHLHVAGSLQLKSPQEEPRLNEKETTCDAQTIHLPNVDVPEMHKACKNWILFSDLHVKSSTIDCCESVLALVHEAAVKRDAGIIFLGDFWHIRGSLNVELLNRVLSSLGKWTQPVVMIPGNHDQVTLGGAVHALEPLRYAFPAQQVVILSDPCFFLGALWIPYRRDMKVVRAVLQKACIYSQ